MKRRCYECKHLEEESAKKYYERTKTDPLTKFFCKTCEKNGINYIPKKRVRKQKVKVHPKIAEMEAKLAAVRHIRQMLNRGLPTSVCEGI